MDGHMNIGQEPAAERRAPTGGREVPNRARRVSKRTLRVVAWAVGAIGFLLPWGVIRALPRPTAAPPQVVYVPAGSRVLVHPGAGATGGVKVIQTGSVGSAHAGPSPVLLTGGSHPRP